jgi:GNAT superfamily N-acetyltransferase
MFIKEYIHIHLGKYMRLFEIQDSVTTCGYDELDAEEVYGLFSELRADHFVGGEFAEDSLISKKDSCLYILSNGKLCGIFNPRKEKNMWRSGPLYIMKSYRNKGIMKKVLSKFFSEHKPGLCWIDNTNAASIQLYKSIGFVKGKEYNLSDTEQGHWYKLQ